MPMPNWTTLKEREVGGLVQRQIDNILTTSDSLSRLTPIGFLDCPSRSDPALANYLPNDANPSDHIPVVVDFLVQ